MQTAARPMWSRLSVLALIGVASCGPDATAPAQKAAISLLIVSGNAQSGVAGTELTQPLVVKVTNSKGQSVAGVVVNFRVTSGGGSLYAGSASSDLKGVAADYWTLGTAIAQPQTVEVRAVLPTGEKQVYGVFTANLLPGPATTISLFLGNGQSVAAGGAVPTRPSVKVTDVYGNPVGGTSITFAPASGGGSVTGAVLATDAQGVAAVGSWILGWGPNTLAATATGLTGNPVTFNATGTGWTTRAPMPTVRQDLAVGVVDGILYAVGGGTAFGSAVATVEAYDPATNTWATKAPMPTARRRLSVAVVNGIMYAIGGTTDFTNHFATVEAYNPSTNSWSTRTAMPGGRSGMGVAVANGIVYAISGYSTGGVVATVAAYDPASNTWSSRTSIPSPRTSLAVCAIDGLLYAAGGDTAGGDVVTVEAYDPVTDTWSARTPMSFARGYLGAGVINGILYTAGGSNNGPQLATFEAYNPITNSWTTKPSMPTGRAWLAGGVSTAKGVFYAIGGWNGSDLGTVEAFQP